jgi:hypothetical protein
LKLHGICEEKAAASLKAKHIFSIAIVSVIVCLAMRNITATIPHSNFSTSDDHHCRKHFAAAFYEQSALTGTCNATSTNRSI